MGARLASAATLRRVSAETSVLSAATAAASTGERLEEARIECSVGTVGDSYDNALAESVIGLYKTEVIRKGGPWRGVEGVEWATLEWVDWFNNRRILGPIGHRSPREHEEEYYRSQTGSAMVVGLK